MHTPTQTSLIISLLAAYLSNTQLPVHWECLNLTRAHQAAHSEMISLYLLLCLYKGVRVHIVPLMNTPNGLPLRQHSLPFNTPSHFSSCVWPAGHIQYEHKV